MEIAINSHYHYLTLKINRRKPLQILFLTTLMVGIGGFNSPINGYAVKKRIVYVKAKPTYCNTVADINAKNKITSKQKNTRPTIPKQKALRMHIKN